ncbi:hypothetical protein D9619_009952 [Psilocybe cf. subviscida]|uniref:Carboxylic ester hydrolase n=1 Tax=Psilocybe cf. subviscida TaxID=2480587 RepID=A0A8H5BLE4_9AGAR|nr:hypothetical protein D9619_009952 [Psilocybe cf. subviscida]
MLHFGPCVLLASLTLALAANPTIKVGGTALNGLSLPELGVEFFGGIPFAEPPLRDLRLKPPVLKTRLNIPQFDASSYGIGCLQPAANTSEFSEDCLTLNIHRPAGVAPNAKLPVMFWTFGGGFTVGSGASQNGSRLVAHSVARGTPIIYVNHNYRLGPLGFPQGQEADDNKILNLALKDTLAALEWVQANIGIFGGDKSKVTVFGESAGAGIIGTLMLDSPLPTMARAAILESGTADGVPPFKAADNEKAWEVFVSAIPSCAALATSGKTLDCLAKASRTEIFSALNYTITNTGSFGLTIDGPNGIVPALPSRLLSSGRFSRMPFIAGTNLDEGTVFVNPESDLSENAIRNTLITRYSPPLVSSAALNATVNQLLKLYPDVLALGSPYNTGNETFGLPAGFKRESAIIGDTVIQAPRRRLTQAASKFDIPAYAYYFTQPQPFGLPYDGVAHTTEIAFVYGTTPDTSPLSEIMMDYWLSYGTSLTPNDGKGSKRPNWPRYTSHNQILMQLNSGNLTVIPDAYRKTQIDFINSNPLSFHH